MVREGTERGTIRIRRGELRGGVGENKISVMLQAIQVQVAKAALRSHAKQNEPVRSPVRVPNVA